MKENNCPLEYEDQVNIFKWAKLMETQYPELEMLNGSLNGVRLTIGQAVKAKKAGMKKGFPDINLPVPKADYHGLYIELKREFKGVVSKEQKKWIDDLNKYGYIAIVCEGYKDCINFIESYLNHETIK